MSISELDEWQCRVVAIRVQPEHAVLKLEKVGHDHEQVRGFLDGQEARARDVDAHCTVEVPDGCAGSLLKLDHIDASVQALRSGGGKKGGRGGREGVRAWREKWKSREEHVFIVSE